MMKETGPAHQTYRTHDRAAATRTHDAAFAAWAAGCGVVAHTDETQVRIRDLAEMLVEQGAMPSRAAVYALLSAADRVANAAMWLVVHMTYARRVRTDGRDLRPEDFKHDPQGHTGGSLNMVPGYVGYLAINALTGITRSWLMGQGHCVAAIDATNLVADNMGPAHAARYDLSEDGLGRFVRDFYSYQIKADGTPESPLGSHVNVHTAGGMLEGGYLGFAELQYVHMPLPGERLVAFLSDGAFEEQRGSDWAPRWWRASDSGLVVPIMIANGRRIDQRATMSQDGGTEWLRTHLQLNGFDPIAIDGRDPAAFAWAIFEMEAHLAACSKAITDGRGEYPVPLHYTIAEAPKGHGFPGAGTNRAHGTPLEGNPAEDPRAREQFNTGARGLFVPMDELRMAVATLNNHGKTVRPKERDHAIARRRAELPCLPGHRWREPGSGSSCSPMAEVDRYFAALASANPELRARVGNPDEMRSNRMDRTLDALKHRVVEPEATIAEALDGRVITALNEEAVVNAALGNTGGLNLVVTYEAFAVKMLGAVRQTLIFARHQWLAGIEPGWLSVPLILTSHLWENGKNEQSHQDPTMAEALMGEMADVSRVLFPADANSAVAALEAAYASRGQVWTLVIPKQDQPDIFGVHEARRLIADGAGIVKGDANAPVQLIAIGAYQLDEAFKAALRLDARGVANSVAYVIEPSRFRYPRDAHEAESLARTKIVDAVFPATVRTRVVLTHTHPEAILGIMRPLDLGSAHTHGLGYLNRGGTLDVAGLLFANRCTWAHAVAKAASGLSLPEGDLLDPEERAAIAGNGDPYAVIAPPDRQGTSDRIV